MSEQDFNYWRGGAIVTDSLELYEKMKLVRSHGRLESSNYFSSSSVMDYVTLGYNFRMSNITAALGRSQLKKIERIINARKSKAEWYIKELRNIDEIQVPEIPAGYSHVYQMFSVMADKRDSLINHLAEKGIMAKIYFMPVHKTHFYSSKLGYTSKLPVTDEVSAKIISLPIHPGIPKEDIDFVISNIKEFYEGS